MKSSSQFFKEPANRYCWADCENLHDGCEGRVMPVLVFSDGENGLMDTGADGMPFFYCQDAIRRDEKTGYRVEIVEVDS